MGRPVLAADKQVAGPTVVACSTALMLAERNDQDTLHRRGLGTENVPVVSPPAPPEARTI